MKYLNGDVGSDITLAKVIEIVEGGETELMITTNGGSFFEALAIRDYLKSTNQIKSIGCLGLVASAGTIIMQGATDRWATAASKFLIHNVQGGVQGDASAVRQIADLLQSATNDIIKDYSNISGKDSEYITALMNEERILSADEAMSLNLINRISNLENYMNKNEDQVKMFTSLVNRMRSALGFKNLVLQSTDGTELDFGSDVETPEQVVEGVPCSVNGEFVLPDGRVLTSEGGKVISIVMPAEENEEMAKLQTENEELKAQLAEMTNKVTTLSSLANDFNDFKKQFSNHVVEATAVPEVIEPKNEELTKRFHYTKKTI